MAKPCHGASRSPRGRLGGPGIHKVGVQVQGLETFNIVLAGSNFPVDKVQLEDFDFDGFDIQVQFRLARILQASAGQYTLQILPDRFQVGCVDPSLSPDRIALLKRATLTFVDEYTAKRSISAVGHNFVGTFSSSIGSATDFMKHLAWRDDFASVIGGSSDPVLSLGTTIQVTDEESRTLRLEPSIRDGARVYYELNFNWGTTDRPLHSTVRDVVDRYSDSVKVGAELIGRLSSLDAEES
jgi:hypothetical protein